MKIAEVKVNATTCETMRLAPIPKGIVGATVSIEYADSEWDGLAKTIVFRSTVTKDMLDSGSEVTIPAEVVSRAGVNLYMGVYGVGAANNVVIPTIWTELGLVNGAAAPSGDSSTDPSLPVWAQIQAAIGNLDELDTEAKSSLVAAVNEALTKGGGEVDPAEVQKIVEDYLKANPPGTGADGKDGITPTIGKNGNWYLGSTDTGKPSRGEDGAVPDIQIGTIETLPAGSNATASMGGTAENPLLNLGIPRGADGQGSGSGGTDISLGLTSATVGQTVRIKSVNADGKPTAWEAAETGEKWEKIAEIIIPDDAEESNALTINKDLNGQPFALLKARLCGKFPKYTGGSTIPTVMFAMLNGKTTGNPSPTVYTSLWPKVETACLVGAVYEVDVSGVQMIESVLRSSGGGWSENMGVYGGTSSYTKYFADSLWAKPITSIGGTSMLIYPGCKFVLYGVRA
jgi:hypothetical protein